MSVNRYAPHVYILPEDDANRQLANGFLLEPSIIGNNIRVLHEAGGWNTVLEQFCTIYATEMDKYDQRFMVLLIDCDGRPERVEESKKHIPSHLANRVFILSSLTEPEKLKQELTQSYENIGLSLARDCREQTETVWNHNLLVHNLSEVARFREHAGHILFK